MLWCENAVGAIVAFTNHDTQNARMNLKDRSYAKPLMIHSSVPLDLDRKLQGGKDVLHVYETASSPNFVLPSHEHYHATMASVAHTRTVGFLKKYMHAPFFDLEAIWDEHTKFEFGERDVHKTMSTMVAEPYVNHVPTVSFVSRDEISLSI
jgi:carboxymethylenebutenolidase